MAGPVRRRGSNGLRSLPSAVDAEGQWRELVDCRVCGAPNGAERDGCFNCGSLLQLREEVPIAAMARLAVGGDDRPGRVVYVRG